MLRGHNLKLYYTAVFRTSVAGYSWCSAVQCSIDDVTTVQQISRHSSAVRSSAENCITLDWLETLSEKNGHCSLTRRGVWTCCQYKVTSHVIRQVHINVTNVSRKNNSDWDS